MLLGLLISTLGLLSCSSPFFLWAFLVLGTLCTIGYFKLFLPAHSLVLLFICSVVGGLLFLVGSLHPSSHSLIPNIGLLLKLGLAPFHFWMLKVVVFVTEFSSFFLLGLMKVGPLFLLIDGPSFTLVWGLFSFCVGLSVLYSCTSVNLILLGSGLLQFWVLSATQGYTFNFYLFSYLFSLLLCCCAHTLQVSYLLSFLSLAGLPPFIFFVAKLSVLVTSPFLVCILVLLVSALRLFPYALFGFSNSEPFVSSSFTILGLVFISFSSLSFVLPSI